MSMNRVAAVASSLNLIPQASLTEPLWRPNPVETRHVQHPGHTSDLKHNFDSCEHPENLENELRNSLESGEYRRRGIEQRPSPKIIV